MSTEKTEQNTTTAPVLKPGQRITVNGNLIESVPAAPEAPAEKLKTPTTGNMNASRRGVTQ